MAHLLFTKYLPTTLTESYDELRVRKISYEAMKSWLFDQFGMIKSVCDNQLRAIRAMKPPKSEDDLLAYAQYLPEKDSSWHHYIARTGSQKRCACSWDTRAYGNQYLSDAVGRGAPKECAVQMVQVFA
jgi:hypothetical protein